MFARGLFGEKLRRLHFSHVMGEAGARLAAWRAQAWIVRESEPIHVLVALAPSLSLFGLGMLFVAKAALGERLDLSVFLLGTSLLVLPAASMLFMALAWSSRSLRRVLPERRLGAEAVIALLTITALPALVAVLPLRESEETAFNRDAGARRAHVRARPAEEATPRQGYCLGGAFYDLVAGQPEYDPNYRGAVLAHVDPLTGAVSCDFSATG